MTCAKLKNNFLHPIKIMLLIVACLLSIVSGTRFSYSDIETAGFPNAQEALEENREKYSNAKEQTASLIDSIDERIKFLNDDDEKKRNRRQSYKQVHYPKINPAGTLVDMGGLEAPDTFDNSIKRSQLEGVSERQGFKADAVITFDADHTGQVKQMRQEEYQAARYILEKEYLRISQIDTRMRALKIKKDNFKRNIDLLKKKYVIDMEAMKRRSSIMEKKINELNKMTRSKEILSGYQRDAATLFDNIYQNILTKEKSSRVLAKNTVNYNSIQTMMYNKGAVENHFAEFRRRADEFVNQASYSRTRKIKYQTADDFRDNKEEIKTLDGVRARLVHALANFRIDFLMSIRGKRRSRTREDYTAADVFDHVEKIGVNSLISNLNDWMENVRDNVRVICDNFYSVIRLKIELQESVRVEKYFEKLNKKLYSTDVSLLTNEYEGLCANADKFFKEREQYIDSLEKLSVGNNRTLEDIVRESDSKIENYSNSLRSIRERANESFGLSNEYHASLYSIQDMIDIIINNKTALLDEENQKMTLQKELFVRKQKYDMYAEVFKLEEGFYDKYRIFLNNKRSAIESMTGESQITDEESIQTGYDVEEEIDLAVRRKMEVLYRTLNACLETISHLYENKDRLGNEDAPAVNEALGQVLLDFDFLMKSVKMFDKRIEEIVENFIRADSHGLLRETFNSEMASLQHEEEELSRCVEELSNSRARINNAFKTGMDNLTQSVNVLKKAIAERLNLVKETEQKFFNQLELFRTKNLMLKELSDAFMDYINFKKELDEGYKNLVKEYADMEKAGLDDWQSIKTEELSLVSSKEAAINKIGELQAFLNKAARDIMVIIPKGQNDTEAYVNGYSDARKF